MEFETIKVSLMIAAGVSLLFALLYHFFNLEEAEE